MKTKVLPLNAILRHASLVVAPLLLGWVIERNLPAGRVRLKIVETEAYHQEDPASHSFRGVTKRTAPMFEAGGRLYVYFTYGMHYAINIVTGRPGVGEAVLLRAAEPLEGIDILSQLRYGSRQTNSKLGRRNLANGPGKLAQAIGITSTELSGSLLGSATLKLLPPVQIVEANDIIAAPRVGIRQAVDLPWRFYIKNNPYVSRLSAGH